MNGKEKKDARRKVYSSTDEATYVKEKRPKKKPDPRPSLHDTMLNMARVQAERSTCARRKVGCILVDINGRILATGNNGVARGQTHCTDKPCPGVKCPSGTGLDLCQAIHAEQNALMFCPDVMKIHTCYTTVSPCVHCLKMLLNTSCENIIFTSEYPHGEAKNMWERAGRSWRQHG